MGRVLKILIGILVGILIGMFLAHLYLPKAIKITNTLNAHPIFVEYIRTLRCL